MPEQRPEEPTGGALDRAAAGTPRVSVIMPTYNRPESLRRALESLYHQTFEDFEALVVNDGGCRVRPVVEAFANRMHIRLVVHEENRGGSAARNTGIAHAQGDYITYLDDDDTIYPEHLETLVGTLESSPHKVVYSDAIRELKALEGDGYVTKSREVFHSHDFDADHILIANFIPIHCVMHERSCLDDSGGFDETLSTHQDLDLWIRMSRHHHFAHIRKVTAEFEEKDDGISVTSRSAERLNNLASLYERYREHASPDVQRLQQGVLARMHLQYGLEPANTMKHIDPAHKEPTPSNGSNEEVTLTLDSIRETFRHTPMPLHACLALRHLFGEIHKYADPIFPPTFAKVTSDGSTIDDPGVAAMLAGTEVGEWSMSADSFSTLIQLVRQRKPRAVLEFGSGVSTLVLAHVMRELHPDAQGPLVFSVEQADDAHKETTELLEAHGLSEVVRCRIAPVETVRVGGYESQCYGLNVARLDDLLGETRPDFVVVDGPHGEFGARFATLPQVLDRIDPHAVVVIDDALRDSELSTADWWQRLGYADFRGVMWVGKGMAVGHLGGTEDLLPGAANGAAQASREMLARLMWHELANAANRPATLLPPPALLKI